MNGESAVAREPLNELPALVSGRRRQKTHRRGSGRLDQSIHVHEMTAADNEQGQVAELWRMVTPGGQLAITTTGLMSSAIPCFWSDPPHRRDAPPQPALS